MTAIFDDKPDSPKVFISYSYDNEKHEKWVERLTNELREKAGVNALIDKFVFNKTSDLDEIMVKGFKDSDIVLIIATKEYAKKAEEGKGGVGYETKLATIIDRSEFKNKLIFIKRDKNASFKEVMPFQFSDHYAIDMSNDKDYDSKFKELYHKIWNKDFVKVAPIGDNPFQISNTSNSFEINFETVFSIIEKSGFEPFNLNKSDVEKNSLIIWPVVPRQHVNLIHYSQIEVIRVLSLLGWKTIVIIANCGQSDKSPNKLELDFKDKLEKCFLKKGINNYSLNFLNSYFSSENIDGGKILSNFVQLSSSLKISQLTIFNTKEGTYDASAQSEINDRSTLKYISPLLTWSASIYEALKFFEENLLSKAIIIAGRDEASQWTHVISEINSHIGAIFIPILKQEDSRTVYQGKKPLFFSKRQLEEELGKGNIDRWLFQSFTNLAEFPNIVHSLPFCIRKEESCTNIQEGNKCLECIFPFDSDIFSNNVDKKKFVDSIYSKIEP